MKPSKIIKAKTDLCNNGLCFTKGKTYELQSEVVSPSCLIYKTVTNDLGEDHIIGNWYKHFSIVQKHSNVK